MNVKHLSIVGGGPAGLVAAIAARQAGFDCTVYEQAASFERIGGAVGIQCNGLQVLDAIGVLDRFRPHIRIATRAGVEAPPGRALSIADFNELDLPHRGFAVAQRYDLQDVLLAAARDAGARIEFGQRCSGIERANGALTLLFPAAARRAEIVLACDGIRSPVRESLAIPARKTFVNEAYLRLVAPIAHPAPERIGEFWHPDGRRAGAFPLPGNRTYVFCSVPFGRWKDILEHGLVDWVRRWRDFGAPISTLMESVSDWSAAVYDELTDLRVSRWYDRGVFLLGDAAHAMTPNLGQGANSAMTDALVLANMLRAFADTERAAREYEAIRKPFVTRIQRTALLGGVMASWTSGPARFIRDSFFRAGSSVPVVRHSSMRLTAGFNPREQRWLRAPSR